MSQKIRLENSLLVVSRVDFYFFPSIIEKDADARKGCPWQPFVHAILDSCTWQQDILLCTVKFHIVDNRDYFTLFRNSIQGGT